MAVGGKESGSSVYNTYREQDTKEKVELTGSVCSDSHVQENGVMLQN